MLSTIKLESAVLFFHGGDAVWLLLFWLFIVLPVIGFFIVYLVGKTLNLIFNRLEQKKNKTAEK